MGAVSKTKGAYLCNARRVRFSFPSLPSAVESLRERGLERQIPSRGPGLAVFTFTVRSVTQALELVSKKKVRPGKKLRCKMSSNWIVLWRNMALGIRKVTHTFTAA